LKFGLKEEVKLVKAENHVNWDEGIVQMRKT